MPITIQISDEQWKLLNDEKNRAETFQDVLNRIIKEYLKIKNIPQIKSEMGGSKEYVKDK